MWPWTHAACAYLCYSLYARARRGDPPSEMAAVVAVVASQVPDLVDKPLAWTLAVLPAGRSLGHSLFTVFVILVLSSLALARLDRSELLAPLAVGYLTAVVTDLPAAVLRGNLDGATYLLWPVLRPPAYALEPSFLAHLRAFEADGSLLFGMSILGIVAAIWVLDGAPGLTVLRRLVSPRADGDTLTD